MATRERIPLQNHLRVRTKLLDKKKLHMTYTNCRQCEMRHLDFRNKVLSVSLGHLYEIIFLRRICLAAS